MKVIKNTTTKGETSASIDLFEGLDLPKKVRDQVSEEVGQYLVEQTLMDVNDSKSPVEGYGSFPALTSKEYKAKKKLEVGSTKPDLQLSGETLNEFSFKVTSEGIKIGVFGDRAPVADGHNNLSGKSELPLRRFIPGEGENYSSNVQREVERIIADTLAENEVIEAKDLADVNSKGALYDILGDRLGLSSRSEIRLAVFRNQDLLDLLREEDLIDYI